MDIKTAKKILSNIKFGQTRNASRIKKGQGLREQKIELTPDDILKKFQEQDGKCYWSNLPLEEKYNYIKRHPRAISVDRLDNQVGYIYENISLTLRIFNLGRGSYYGNFREVMDYIFIQFSSSDFPSYKMTAGGDFHP